jgi:hypothetical protein
VGQHKPAEPLGRDIGAEAPTIRNCRACALETAFQGGPLFETAAPAPAASPEGVTRKSSDERKEALGRAIHTQVAQGARVESQCDYAVLATLGALAGQRRCNAALALAELLTRRGLERACEVLVGLAGAGVKEAGAPRVLRLRLT